MSHLYLYVALIGVVLVLFALTRAKSPSAGSSVVPASTDTALPSAAIDQELKKTFEEFMNELERENSHTLRSFTALERETQMKLAEQQDVIQALEHRLQEVERMLATQAPASQRVASEEPVVDLAEQAANLEPKAPSFLVNEKYTKVVELSNRGLSPQQIARETGIGIGEIQLVLGLVKREEAR